MAKTGGRLSKKDWEYIQQHYKEMSYDDMAAEISKSPLAVKNYVQSTLGYDLPTTSAKEAHAVHDLKSSDYWPEIKKQFSEGELVVFLQMWGEMIAQFRDNDIYFTEQSQIIDVITLTLLMNRALVSEKSNMDSINVLRKAITQEKVAGSSLDIILPLEEKLSFAMSAQESLGRSYRDLLDKKNKMWKDLRATRSDRVKEIEERKKNFGLWMGSLLKKVELRRAAGLRMEKHRLAAEKEYGRLSEYHEFGHGADKEVDRPLLTPDTVVLDDEDKEDK